MKTQSSTNSLTKLGLVLSACHLGLLGGAWFLACKLADNYLPSSLIRAYPFLEDWFYIVTKILDIFCLVLAYPIGFLYGVVLELPAKWAIGAVMVVNSLLWGFALAEIVRFCMRRRKTAAAEIESPGDEALPSEGFFSNLRRPGTITFVLVYLGFIVLLGPARWLWGTEIIRAIGLDSISITQGSSSSWDRGGAVELFLNEAFFLGVPALAAVLYKRPLRVVAFIVVSWFAAIIWAVQLP